MLHKVVKLLLVLGLYSNSGILLANDIGYSVLGVIASTKNQEGVALLKNKQNSKVSAFKVGDKITNDLRITKIFRKTVNFDLSGQAYTMNVGDDEASSKSASESALSVASNLSGMQGIEKNGDTLVVNRDLKDELVNKSLDKVLMQAAAVPHVMNGRLVGFQLLEIDAGSIYDVAGFQNGDVITHINDQPINDAGLAVRALNSLKSAATANFNYIRQNQELSLTIQIN